MRNNIFIHLMSLLLFLNSCSSSYQVVKKPDETKKPTIGTRIFVFRPNIMAKKALPVSVFQNGDFVGKLYNKSYLVWDSNISPTVLDVDGDRIKIDGKMGDNFYFKIVSKLETHISNKLFIERITADEASKYFNKLKPPKERIER